MYRIVYANIRQYVNASFSSRAFFGSHQRGFRVSSSRIEVKRDAVPNTSPKIRLRDYQEDCIQSVLSYLDHGHKRLGVSLATGSGKTVIFTQLIDRVKPLSEDATQTLILAHRRELVEQAARHCTSAYPSKSVEVEMGSIHASGFADITVASVQSVCSGERMLKFDPSKFKLVLVDEAHHIVASKYLEILNYFGLRTPKRDTQTPALVGVSATFSRFDGRMLGEVIDHIVYHRDYVDMIRDKWLSDATFTTVESKADVSKVKSGVNGDFQSGDLSRAVNTDETNFLTVQAWIARASTRKSTLVFCVDLAHLESLTTTFREHGYDARFVTGDTPRKIRGDRLDAFRCGEFPVLLNCGVFTEGTDIPNIDCVVLARPTRSRNLLVQMVGRGMRLHPGKVDCHIIDMVASLSTGIVSTPTLFGLDSSCFLENVSIKDMESIRERKEREAVRERELAEQNLATKEVAHDNVALEITHSVPVKTLHFTDYDSVNDLIEDNVEDRGIRRQSQFAWIAIGDERYVLSTSNGDYLTLESSNRRWIVKYTQKLPQHASVKSPYKRPQQIATADSFEHALHAADTFASEVFEYTFINKHQAWRRKPASEAQIKFLNKFRSQEDQIAPEEISKGKATDMITKIMRGAKGRFAKIESLKKKVKREVDKEDAIIARQEQEKVRVGPLSVP